MEDCTLSLFYTNQGLLQVMPLTITLQLRLEELVGYFSLCQVWLECKQLDIVVYGHLQQFTGIFKMLNS